MQYFQLVLHSIPPPRKHSECKQSRQRFPQTFYKVPRQAEEPRWRPGEGGQRVPYVSSVCSTHRVAYWANLLESHGTASWRPSDTPVVRGQWSSKYTHPGEGQLACTTPLADHGYVHVFVARTCKKLT